MTPHDHLKVAKQFARLLDEQFSIGKLKFGLDPIVNIIPGLGDVVGMVLALYLVWIALHLGVPKGQIYWMVWHIFVDFVIGIIPFLGTIGDIFYKANEKNLKIIEASLPKITSNP